MRLTEASTSRKSIYVDPSYGSVPHSQSHDPQKAVRATSFAHADPHE